MVTRILVDVADDLITFGGPERRSKREADEAIESLFHTYYPRLVRTALASGGDQEVAEQLAQEAFLRLWRRWRRISGPEAALSFLQRTVVNLARETIMRRAQTCLPSLPEAETASLPGTSVSTVTSQTSEGLRQPGERLDEIAAGARPASEAESDTDPERWLTETTGAGPRPVDTGRAWQDLQRLRSRTVRNRRTGLTGAVSIAAAAAVAIAVPALARGGGVSAGPGHTAGRSSGPRSPGTYPGAVVARLPLSGVVSVVGDGATAWAVSHRGQAGIRGSYQLVKIDLPTDRVMLRTGLGSTLRSVAAGDGAVWLTTGHGRARGQLARIDPVTGTVVVSLHLPAGVCTFVTYSAGSLWAECADGGDQTEFLRVNPSTGRVIGRAGRVRGQVSSVAIAPQALWYSTGYTGITGLLGVGGKVRPTVVTDPPYPGTFYPTRSVVYGQGTIWALTEDRRVVRIDPATGRVIGIYVSSSRDTAGLEFLAVGDGSLWLLDNGPPSAVLRVSIATGRPLGRIPGIVPESRSRPCWQIYFTPGAVWVPTQQQLIRIDPARLPG